MKKFYGGDFLMKEEDVDALFGDEDFQSAEKTKSQESTNGVGPSQTDFKVLEIQHSQIVSRMQK
jgi:hypothetical protein